MPSLDNILHIYIGKEFKVLNTDEIFRVKDIDYDHDRETIVLKNKNNKWYEHNEIDLIL